MGNQGAKVSGAIALEVAAWLKFVGQSSEQKGSRGADQKERCPDGFAAGQSVPWAGAWRALIQDLDQGSQP